jgi:hypothetical protein
MYDVIGDKYMYLTFYVHLVGINEVIYCKNARSRKLKKKLCVRYFLCIEVSVR